MKGLLGKSFLTPELLARGPKRRRIEIVKRKRRRVASGDENLEEQQQLPAATTTTEEPEVPATVPNENHQPEVMEFEASNSSIVFQGTTAIAHLEPEQLLAFDGCGYVRLLEGKSSVLGYTLRSGEQILVSSDSSLCSALTFKAGGPKCGCKLEFRPYHGLPKEEPDSPTRTFTLELVKEMLEEQTEVENEESEDENEEFDERMSRKRKAAAAEEEEESPRNIRPTIVPSSWSVAADSISKQHQAPVVATAGGKCAGKSTFGRFLVNRLLNSHKEVAYLDVDVGQPEFTIPGCLSLHILQAPIIGAPALHLREPERCFYYGDISSRTDPGLYMKFVVNLYDYFRHRYYSDTQRLPLVINTPGWLTGIGYDILIDILRYTVPTHLVKIGDTKLPEGHFWDAEAHCGTTITCIGSYSEKRQKSEAMAAEMRASRILAYFQQCTEKLPVLDEYASTAKALVRLAPYQISASDINIVHLHIEVPPSQDLYALNAQLVGLGTASQGECVISCVGFGLIRGVDTSANTLYILTPCTLEVLQDVDTILHGRVELPAALLQCNGFVSPYLCGKSVDIRGTSILRRRRKMSRKACNSSS